MTNASIWLNIIGALEVDLQARYPTVRVDRNGAQIILSRSSQFAAISIGAKGISIHSINSLPHENYSRGPFILEDPNMLDHLYAAVDQWSTSHVDRQLQLKHGTDEL